MTTRTYLQWGDQFYSMSKDKLRSLARAVIYNWGRKNLGVNFKDYGTLLKQKPRGAKPIDVMPHLGDKAFWQRLAS